ncbi:OLC1v1005951C1 [Oldenlandia corymbosa var. corymbosa]|uniref:OLC1v1005951C1 n=1 Tax=Oldenlandia corymbosa var. corymbosa TaxID=529605 RepID=A0AAV1DFS2_OLDCO|nr:OLC1v1005951C1 [Oldenlandia corymbosa var. corymbosa]
MADQNIVVVPDSNNLFDFVAKKGHGIKGLVDSGIAKVPELYIQPPQERVFDHHQEVKYLSVSNNSSISSLLSPIDLSKLDGPEHEKVVDDIVRAAKTTGFFQVINHGVDLESLESIKDAAHRFFSQPTDSKTVYLKGASISPYVRYTTSFAPEKEKKLEWRDHISMIYTNDNDAEKHWPSVCKKEVLDYMKSTYKTARRLFEILIENLGVEPEESMLESLAGFKVVNMNFYPACPSPELTIGAGRHSDMSTLTVLLQDDNGGLFVKIEEDVGAGKQEEWIEIPPISGALVINVGDALQVRLFFRKKKN